MSGISSDTYNVAVGEFLVFESIPLQIYDSAISSVASNVDPIDPLYPVSTVN